MANFKAHHVNVGSDSLPQFQVYITLQNCGIRDGIKCAVTNCATISELEEQVAALFLSLNEAYGTAKAFLQENEGGGSN
jgi:hypothetical protein